MNCQNFVIFVLIKMVLAQNNTAAPQVTIYSRVVYSSIYTNCHVKSFSNINTILWYKNNHLFSCSSPDCKLTTSHTKEEYWSNISYAYVETGNNFTCVAENVYGKSSDSFIIPCIEGSCLEWTSSQVNYINVKVGQSVPISCELTSQKEPIKVCFEFGIRHHNHSYNIKNVSVKMKDLFYTIKYMHNIFNISKNDSGTYTCYYKFMTVMEKSRCPRRTDKSFILVVTEPSSGEKGKKRHHVTIAIAVSLGSVLVGLFLTLWIFCLCKKKIKPQRLNESDPELRWDVFISYSSKDFDWVKDLCKTLEQPPFNLTVCLHQRDWEVGKTVLDNMAESIYCSQKTLLIVSKSYLESSFCLQELNIAVDCEYSTQKVLKERIIVVKLDDVSLKNFPKALKQKSYLDFSNPEQRKHYKTKLLRALPRREIEDESLPAFSQSDNEGCQDENDQVIKLDEIINDKEQVAV